MARRPIMPGGYEPDSGIRRGGRPPAGSMPTPITDVGHGPMNFGGEAGPPNPGKYTHVKPLRTLKPVRPKRK